MTRVVNIGPATLYLGDCRELMPTVDADVLLGDPPYGMGYKSNYNQRRYRQEDAAMRRRDGDFAPTAGDDEPFDPSPILKLALPTILWGANHYASRLPDSSRWLVWDKLAGKTPTPSSADIEMAWTNLRGPARVFTHLWRGIMRAGEENVRNGPKLHSHQKPVALMSWCLGFMPSGTVLDPYMGSGSTGIAALRAGRKFVGIELIEDVFELACARLETEWMTLQGTLLSAAE
jgi:site-specific DNA-methyltransferase (adenine-specific)